MNIKILAAVAVALVGFSASMARADEHTWRGRDGHDGRGFAGRWDHDRRGHDGYRGPHGDYRYVPRYYNPHYYAYAPRYCAPAYYPPAYYAPAYYGPAYYGPAYPVARVDDLGVVIQLRLP